jgi:hypothetical protein
MFDDKTGWTPARLGLTIAIVLLLAVAIALRIVALDRIPGINGDEAYYGAVVMNLKAGKGAPLTTPSGLPLNPFYTGLLFIVQLPFGPSFWLLRLPALLSGVALLGMSYPLLRHAFDKATALGTTLLLACLPITIAFSRFGWDQSQAPLVSLLCLYFAIQRQMAGAVALFIVALIVHPFNVFLAPIMLGPAAAERIPQLIQTAHNFPRLLLRIGAFLLIGGLVCVAALWLLVPGEIVTNWVEHGALPQMGLRLINPGEWVRFALLYGDLLTGTSIYEYVAGPVAEWSAITQRVLFWTLVAGLLGLGLPNLIRQRNTTALGIVGGLLVSLASYYIVLGPSWIGPGLGAVRYAMCLVVPSCLAVVLLARGTGESPAHHLFQSAGLLAVCALLLGGFYGHYFLQVEETGGQSHRTFRTGPVEPKAAALAAILAASNGEPATILAEDYWTYFPIRYLAGDRPELHFVWCKDAGDQPSPGRAFLVGFTGGPCDRWLAQHDPERPKQVISDYAGRPVLYVWDLGEDANLWPGLKAAAAAEFTAANR